MRADMKCTPVPDCAPKRDVIDLDPRPLCRDEQNSKHGLYDATPGCDGRIYDDFYRGGGVKCTKCSGWFCF